jgi:hypothetical protein
MDCVQEAKLLFETNLHDMKLLQEEFKECSVLHDYQYLLYKLSHVNFPHNKLFPHHSKRLSKMKTALYNKLDRKIYSLTKHLQDD